MTLNTPSLPSRAHGLLLGLASGNCLGTPWSEIWPKDKILAQSAGKVLEIDSGEKERPWNADLAQAVLAGEALLEKKSIEIEDLGRHLLLWMTENGRGIAVLTRRVLEDVEQGTPVEEASSYACESLGRNWSAGNGALSRGISLVPALWGRQDQLIEATRQAARTTHWNPLCEWSSIALNLALADAFAGIPLDCRTLAETLRTLGAPGAVADAVDGAKAPLDRFQLDGKTKLFTLKSMQVGLWALRAEGTPESILERVILEGGATDTNAALAGAAVGARFGIEALPQEWIANLARPADLTDLADRLLAFEG
jgi:ADP-ribosylglycohydrolase